MKFNPVDFELNKFRAYLNLINSNPSVSSTPCLVLTSNRLRMELLAGINRLRKAISSSMHLFSSGSLAFDFLFTNKHQNLNSSQFPVSSIHSTTGCTHGITYFQQLKMYMHWQPQQTRQEPVMLLLSRQLHLSFLASIRCKLHTKSSSHKAYTNTNSACNSHICKKVYD